MPKIKPFENYTQRYEEWFERYIYVYESELNALRKLLPPGKGIEIGVGSGRFAAPLGIKFGVEPSVKMARLARERGIEVIRGIAEALPIKDCTFDFALMATTVCFLDDIHRAFEEVKRILRPGGYLLVGFVDRESRIGRKYETHKEESVFYSIAKFYSTREVLGYLNKAGFIEIEIVQTLFKDLKDIRVLEPVKSGYGEGSFVVIRARST